MFEEGAIANADEDGQVLAVEYVDDKPQPIVVRHAYSEPGEFTLKAQYLARSTGKVESAPVLNGRKELTIVVAPDYLTNAELADEAWRDLYDNLDELLGSLTGQSGATVKSGKLALTSIEDANYEGDPAFELLVDRLTRLMVQGGYRVLEKDSQVLSRLAPEAVVDISRELAKELTPRRPRRRSTGRTSTTGWS